MREQDLSSNEQAETEVPFGRHLARMGAAEGVEDERKILRGNRLAPVGDLDDDVRHVAACLDHHRRPGGSVFDGIADQVGQRLRDAIGVPGAGDVALDVEGYRCVEFGEMF